jgi:hypothetical protein
MQRQWYFLHHPKTNTFWMCDTDLARIGDLRCRTAVVRTKVRTGLPISNVFKVVR